MKLLLELLTLIETKKKKKATSPSRTMRQKVYHSDYVKTKDEPYRKYDHEERKGE